MLYNIEMNFEEYSKGGETIDDFGEKYFVPAILECLMDNEQTKLDLAKIAIELTNQLHSKQELINDQEQKIANLNQELRVDKMTGFGNKIAFEETIHNLSEYDDCAVIGTDIGGLGKINNTLGYLVGDKYLMAIADIFKKELTKIFGEFDISKVLFRWGGDEFFMVFKKIKLNYSTSENIVEKIETMAKEVYNQIIQDNQNSNLSRLYVSLTTKELEDDGKMFFKKILDDLTEAKARVKERRQ